MRHHDVCIAGGGPAGMVLGLLLARGGLDVVVLEKHRDFLRDFRGDTIHPVTVDLLDDLGLLDELREIEHTEVTTFDAVVNGVRFTPTDFSGVGRSGRLWFMPQWDLLDVLARAAEACSTFELRMGTEVTGLTWGEGRVTGVEHDGPHGHGVLTADVVVGADGRDSAVRDAAGLRLRERGVPLDVEWFRVARPQVDPPHTIAYIGADTVVTIPRPGYYQLALLIPDGGDRRVREAGIESLRERVVATVPFLASTVDGIRTWDDVRLLNVRLGRAPVWSRPGVVVLGDAAHPMSPAFGVGINDAVQDAVALARILLEAPPGHRADASTLDRLRQRRWRSVAAMQRIQQAFHRTVGRAGEGRRLPPARLLRAAAPALTVLTRPLLGRLIGRGLRTESLPAGLTPARPAPR